MTFLQNEYSSYVFFNWGVQNSKDYIFWERGKGVYIYDQHDRKYLDFTSSFVHANIGYGNPRLAEVATQQMNKIQCYNTVMAGNETVLSFAKKLSTITPGELNKFIFTVGGATGVEMALKIAIAYTGKNKFFSRYHSYHGATLGALTITGNALHHIAGNAEIPHVKHFHPPHCYQCPFGKEISSCQIACLDYLEGIIILEDPNTIAAIVIDGAHSAANGHFSHPDGYLKKIRAICDKYKILLIVDEVMSGMGRTGAWFAVDHEQVVPDILITSKGLTCGYMPFGAVAVSPSIAEYFNSHFFPCGETSSNHPVACAIASEVLKIIEEENLIENSKTMGNNALCKLKEMQAKYYCLGDCRGTGLFIALELVKNKTTKMPWGSKKQSEKEWKNDEYYLQQLQKFFFRKGTSYSNKL